MEVLSFFLFIHCMLLALPHTCKAKEVIFTTRDQILQPKFTRLSSKKLKGAQYSEPVKSRVPNVIQSCTFLESIILIPGFGHIS